jgi:uncharacterized protein
VLRGKTPELGPRLLACRARFATSPAPGHELPPIVIELPDGTLVTSDSGDADQVLTCYFGRPMRLVSSAPPGSGFVTGRTEFVAATGLPALVGDESLLDASPLSVLTTSALDRLGAARPETLFDHRRFRMNVVVSTAVPGFVENSWAGRALWLGEQVRLAVAFPTPRCALTTMAQEDLPRDPAVLRTVARENSLDVGGRSYACLGVYAAVESAGEIRLGDSVSLERLREESA